MKILALAGGVGGAKLVDGLAQILPPENLTVIVNTGDDFEYWGLKVCPDLDTVCYTLAGLANPDTGWGRADETWHVFESVTALGGDSWFRLGDRDLGLHLERTQRLREGESLSEITRDFCQAWGVRPTVLPMSDDLIPTMVTTNEGVLPFQEYFVQRKCQPRVSGFNFMNIERSEPAPGVLHALQESDLVVICPSNPWVSIDPILAVPTLKSALSSRPIVGVSPIIGGKAVKGPAARMYRELGIQPSALAVAQHYQNLITGFVFDTVDVAQDDDIRKLDIQTLVTDTLMKTSYDRRRLAQDVLQFYEGMIVSSKKFGGKA
ncbi:MAG: 2-phospho-L-lactate transferase [Anaerolineales bacterium]|nr:2-phospho-L-lactate transferase [Anaerolineales bacterium]